MTLKPILILILLISSESLVHAQDAKFIREVYGSGKKVWEVREDVLMQAEFDKDALPCRIVLQPNRFSGDTVLIGRKYLDVKSAKLVIDALAPLSSRGKIIVGGFTSFGGGVLKIPYYFENVNIVYYSGFRYFDLADKEKLGDAEPEPVADDTPAEEATSIEVAVVT